MKNKIFKPKLVLSNRKCTKIRNNIKYIGELVMLSKEMENTPKDSTLIQKLISNLDSFINKSLKRIDHAKL